jgi:hypothetical protein
MWRRIANAAASRRVDQLSGPRFAPSASPAASEGLASDVYFIIVDAEGNKFLAQAVGEQGDDIAVFGRGGLAGVGRA